MDDWAEIRRLHRAEAMPIKAIVRRTGVSRNAVRRALAAEAPVTLPEGVVTPAALGCDDNGLAEDYYASLKPPPGTARTVQTATMTAVPAAVAARAVHRCPANYRRPRRPPPALAAAKRATSELTGRFVRAAAEANSHDLVRFSGTFEVPSDVVAECALLEAVALKFVMRRADVEPLEAAERELLVELVELLVTRGPGGVSPALRSAWEAATTPAGYASSSTRWRR